MDILNRILSVMANKGISQKALTDYLSLNKSAFSDWKSGKSNSFLKYISKISEYLGVSTDYLLGTEYKDNTDKINEDEIKFALFNGSKGVTDAMYEEVKQFAAMVKLREEAKKKEKN